MKKLLLTLILLISSALYHSIALAQYEPSTQLGLPEGAITRFCKGYIKKIEYSPDGSRVAVITYRDVWIYDAKTGEELNLLTGQHTDRVFDATYSPDGKTLATVSFDKTVRLWDVDTGWNTRTLKGHTEQVYTVAYSPDGKTLTTGGYDKVVHLWDAHTGKKLRTLKGHTESLDFVGYALNGNVIVSAGSDRTVRLWDVDKGKLTNLLHPYETPIAISPNGETVIVTSSSTDEIKSIGIDREPGNDTFLRIDKGKDEVHIFNVATGQPVRTFITDNHVDSMTYSADGKLIATVAEGGVKLWNATTGKLINTLIEKDVRVGCIAFSPDGKTFATGCMDGTMRWWDLESGSNVKAFIGFTDVWDAIEFSPDGKTIAITNYNDISLWNVTTGKLLKTLRGHGWIITGMTFSPDGKTIATSSHDGTAQLWDVNTGSNKFVLVELADHTGAAVRIEKPVFSPDGKTIAASSKNYMLWLWDAHTGKNIKTLQGEGGNFARSFDFSPDSQLLATDQKDRSVLIMNARTGQHINILDRPGYDMVFSPDSKTLTTYFDNGALLWNPFTGELIKHIHSPQAFMTTVLHLHNKPFAITSYKDETASLWDVTTGDRITKFKLPDNMYAAVFRLLYPGDASITNYEIACSPTGKTFAISVSNKPVRLWDVAKGELIGIPIKHLKDEGGYTVLKYSPDGKTLATIPVGTDAYAGGTVRLWNASTGRHLKTLRGYTNCEFNSVAFSPDSKTIATGHKDGTVLLWDIPSP